MTAKESLWLEYEAKRTGKSVEQVREEMRQRSKLADRSKSGFASKSPEERKAISQLGVEARKAKLKKT